MHLRTGGIFNQQAGYTDSFLGDRNVNPRNSYFLRSGIAFSKAADDKGGSAFEVVLFKLDTGDKQERG